MGVQEDTYAIDRDDVSLEEFVEACEECQDSPATVVVMIDFRSAGMKMSVGHFCRPCAVETKERIQDGLPVAVSSS